MLEDWGISRPVDSVVDSAALYEAWEEGKAGLRVVDGQEVNVGQRLIRKEMEREDPVGRIAELPATLPVGHVNGDCGFDYCDGRCAEIEEDRTAWVVS